MAIPVYKLHRSKNILYHIALCALFAAFFFLVFSIKGTCADGAEAVHSDADVRLSVDPVEDKDGFLAVLYNIRNGLPTSEANAIAQTKEGFIWIGSYAGLIRYDSNNFEQLEFLSDIANVRCLYVDSKDRLWVGTNDAGVYLIDNDEVTHFGKNEGLKSISVRELAEDADGCIYMATASGVGMIDSQLKYSQLEDEKLDGQSINLIRVDNSGLVYGVTITGDIFIIKDRALEVYIAHSDFSFESVLVLQPDMEKDGYVYLGTEHYLYYGTLSDSFKPIKEWELAPVLGAKKLKVIGSDLWICGRNGLGKLDNGVVKMVENIPMDNSIDNIMVDNEGNMWVSSSRQGVMKIVPNQFLDLYDKYGLDRDVINSTCHYEGNLIIGSESGLVVLKNGIIQKKLLITEAVTASGKDIKTDNLLSYLDGFRIRFVMTDSRNRLWVGTAREVGLLCYDHGKLLQFTEEDGMTYNTIRNVEECSDGSFIVATNGGINVIKNERVVKSYDKDDGFSVSYMLCVTEGFNGEIIAGSDGGGIYIIKDDKVRAITTEDGLGSDVVLRIKKSRKKDCYWVVTGNSISVMTPDYELTTLRDFPYSNNYDIYENSKGDLWVLGSSGIYVISNEYFDPEEDVLPIYFGIANGLPYVNTANSYSELDSDMNLYMAGNEGVVRVNIDRPLENVGEIDLVLPYVDADGTYIYPDGEGNFNIPGSATRVTIYPYVVNYSLINPQVSYQLQGFDSKEYVTRKNELSAPTYTNLQVGTYDFVMGVRDPIYGTKTTKSFHIIKGRQLSMSAAGSIILDSSALLFLGGLWVFTKLNRKRGRTDDRLFFIMIVCCVAMCFSDIASFLLEGSNIPFGRPMMAIFNTLYYSGIVVLPYIYYLYLEYRRDKNCFKNRKKYFLMGIPCFVAILFPLSSAWTGLIFNITAENEWVSGPLDEYIFVPFLFYAVPIFTRLLSVNVRLVVLAILIVGIRVLANVWMQYVSATAFVYSVTLLCIHIYAISKEMIEGKT